MTKSLRNDYETKTHFSKGAVSQSFKRKWMKLQEKSKLFSRRNYSTAWKDICTLYALEPTADKKVALRSLFFSLFIFYCLGVNNFSKSFASWLSERAYISEMVENGIKVWEEMTFFSLNMTLPA